MFTIRVENATGHRVLGCEQYRVERVTGEATLLSLEGQGEPGSGAALVTEVVIGQGEQAFVMNAQGKTVDVIRARD